MNPRKDAAAVHDAGHGLHKIGIGGDDDDDAVNTVLDFNKSLDMTKKILWSNIVNMTCYYKILMTINQASIINIWLKSIGNPSRNISIDKIHIQNQIANSQLWTVLNAGRQGLWVMLV